MGEWTDVTLGDVLTLQRGFDLPQRKRRPGPYPVVSSAGFTGFHDEFKVGPPGVVIGRYGSLGTVHWVQEPFWPLNTALWVKDFKGNDPRFISYLLKTVTVDGSAAAAVPGVNRNHLHKQCVRVPSMRLQRRIVALLSTLDELIEINERRIELLEDLARSLYREWFVHFRYPGHTPGLDAAPAPVPEGWQVHALGELIEINRDTIKASELPDPVDYLDISSVGNGNLKACKPMGAAEAPSRARRRVADGDVVWSTVRPNRQAHCVIHDPAPNLIASTGLAVLSPVGVPSSFLFEYASSEVFSSYLVGRATGSAYPAVRPKDFAAAPVILPPKGFLDRFDSVVDPMLRLRTALQRQSTALSFSRDLLLPRLVTGQLDISDIDLGVLTPPDPE